MNNFFQTVGQSLKQGQQMTITIQNNVDSMTVSVDTPRAVFTATGTPEEIDQELAGAIKAQMEKPAAFTINVSEKKSANPSLKDH